MSDQMTQANCEVWTEYGERSTWVWTRWPIWICEYRHHMLSGVWCDRAFRRAGKSSLARWVVVCSVLWPCAHGTLALNMCTCRDWSYTRPRCVCNHTTFWSALILWQACSLCSDFKAAYTAWH